MITSAIIGHMTAAQAENDQALVSRLLEIDPMTPLATLPHEACRERCPALRSGHHQWKNHEPGFSLIAINHYLLYTHLTVGRQGNISADLNEHGALPKWDEA